MNCWDVQGAFHKFGAEMLMSKLSALNLDAKLLSVIRSWLHDWRGYVIVCGCQSIPTSLRNMVFQGTVWGPSLWNVFFGDSTMAIRSCGFDVVVYADDCNAFKEYHKSISNAPILGDIREC